MDEALRLVSDRPGAPGEVIVLGTASALSMLAREIPAALETGHRAMALARERGDRVGLVRALNAVGSASWFDGPGRGRAAARRVDGVRRAGCRTTSASARPTVNLGSGAGEVRRYEVARRWLEEASSLLRPSATSTTSHAYATSWLARVELEQGRLGPSRWSWPTPLGDGNGDPISHIGALTVSGRVRVRRGLPGGADPPRRGVGVRAAVRSPAAALAGGGRPRGGGLVRRAARTHSRAGHRDARPRVRLSQPWAVGELGWWLERAGTTRPDVGAAAAPYAAMIARDWDRAAALWDELGCPWEAALARAETDDPATLELASEELHRLGATIRRGAYGAADARPRRHRRHPPPSYDGRQPGRTHRP